MINEELTWNKEIKVCGQIFIIYKEDLGEIIISIWKKRLKDVVFFKLKLGDEYPFSPPRATIGTDLKNWNSLYDSFFNITGSSIKNWRRKHGANNCPCCKSLLCGQNWGPMRRIKEIAEEFSDHMDEKLELRARLYFDIIIKKFHFDFPEDLIIYIKEFI
jgi:hypothetical protein